MSQLHIIGGVLDLLFSVLSNNKRQVFHAENHIDTLPNRVFSAKDGAGLTKYSHLQQRFFVNLELRFLCARSLLQSTDSMLTTFSSMLCHLSSVDGTGDSMHPSCKYY